MADTTEAMTPEAQKAFVKLVARALFSAGVKLPEEEAEAAGEGEGEKGGQRRAYMQLATKVCRKLEKSGMTVKLPDNVAAGADD